MCQEEFQLHRFKLNHPDAKDFVESPWFSRVIVVVYRIVLAVYCSVFIVYSGFRYKVSEPEKWFIYLTNWGYFTVTVYFVLAAAISLMYFLKKRKHGDAADIQTRGANYKRADGDVEVSFPATGDDDAQEPMTWYYKAFWVIHVIAGTGSIIITLLYWILLFRGDTDILDISTHLFNSLFMIADTMLSSTPVRYLHFVYSSAFAGFYGVFSVVYWVAGGTDTFGRPFIYSYLNYEESPGVAAGLVVGSVLLMSPLCHAILFGFYKLRVFLSIRCGRM